MSFTEEEIAYLGSQRLCRVATVSSDGQPDVVPVGYEFDGTYIYVGGLDPAKTRKFRNVKDGSTKVALVIDDLVSAQPWTPRYLRVYGTAELVEREGQFGSAPYMRITPTVSWSWNLEGQPFGHDRDVVIQRTVHDPKADTGTGAWSSGDPPGMSSQPIPGGLRVSPTTAGCLTHPIRPVSIESLRGRALGARLSECPAVASR